MLEVDGVSLPASRSAVVLLDRFLPRARIKSSVEYWVKTQLGIIAEVEWLLPGLYRVAQIINQLDPTPESPAGDNQYASIDSESRG